MQLNAQMTLLVLMVALEAVMQLLMFLDKGVAITSQAPGYGRNVLYPVVHVYPKKMDVLCQRIPSLSRKMAGFSIILPI